MNANIIDSRPQINTGQTGKIITEWDREARTLLLPGDC
jgi:hypothetical protein